MKTSIQTGFETASSQKKKLFPAFRESMEQLGELHIIGNDSGFWNGLFQRQCIDSQLNPKLEPILGTMLRSGFNWVAESGWLSEAMDKLKRGYQAQNRTFTQNRKDQVFDQCPPIWSQPHLENGFPWNATDDRVRDRLRENFSFLANVGMGDRLRVILPQLNMITRLNQALATGQAPLRSVGRTGITVINPINQNTTRIPCEKQNDQIFLRHEGQQYDFRILIHDQEAFANYLTKEEMIVDDFGTISPRSGFKTSECRS